MTPREYQAELDELALITVPERGWRLDRWMEAVYGGRLRFHASPEGNANEPPSYWRRVYDRWAELYHGEVPS